MVNRVPLWALREGQQNGYLRNLIAYRAELSSCKLREQIDEQIQQMMGIQ